MVARPNTPFRSGNAGEMSRDARGRIDIKPYYSAFLAAKNVEPVPQGGFRQMGGSWHLGEWRRPLAGRAVSGSTVFPGPHTGTQTIWTATVAGTVAAVFCDNLTVTGGAATFTVEAETAPGVWTAIGGPYAAEAGVAQDRLAAFAPGAQRTATSLRIVATFATPGSTVTLDFMSAFFESGTAIAPRFVEVTLDDGAIVIGWITAGICDFWTDAGYQGAVYLPQVTAGMLRDLEFYAEARTIGLFHETLESLRLFLVTPSALADWRVSPWPYDPAPKADLGGVYPKTDDVWEIWIRWAADTFIYLTVTVDGETTPAIPLKNGGVAVLVNSATGPNWAAFAADVALAIEALPTVGAPVTVAQADPGTSNSRKLTLTFGGALAGTEYQVSALITNTADASSLPFHTAIGETELEPLISVARGWPGGVELVQDRMSYQRLPAATGALALSRIGEYFDLDVEANADNAARLDRLRSQTNEKVLHVVHSTYLVVFTDRGTYFAPNRTIERNTPLNFVRVSEIGAQPTARPFELEGELHYVAINPLGLAGAVNGGNQILKAVYDDVSTKYSVAPISLIASHLISGVRRSVVQAAGSDLDAARVWLPREDGRLIAGQFIASQEITGFVEWIAAHGGLVREIGMDGRNRLWLGVERGGVTSYELYDTALFLQDAVSRTPDLSGVVSGLSIYEGRAVWAVASTGGADGYVLGPFTVTGAQIALGDSYASAIVGRWQPPYAETMPQVFVTGNDEVVWRPGRITEVQANVIDTTSLAIGANGEAPVDVILNRVTDPVDAPMPARNELVTVTGDQLLGRMVGTTAVFTQMRPGTLRIRDFFLGTKL